MLRLGYYGTDRQKLNIKMNTWFYGLMVQKCSQNKATDLIVKHLRDRKFIFQLSRKYIAMMNNIILIQKRIKGYFYKNKFYKDRLIYSVIKAIMQIYNEKQRSNINKKNQRVSIRNID